MGGGGSVSIDVTLMLSCLVDSDLLESRVGFVPMIAVAESWVEEEVGWGVTAVFSYLIVSVLWVDSVPTVMLVVEDGGWMGWDACRWYASSVVLERIHFLRCLLKL